MEKNIREDLIELSITNLIQCLEENNKKEVFVKDLKGEYPKIVSLMRQESTIIQMRQFHNWIKSTLITNITEYYYSMKKNNRVALLDIAVGRGGDLMKWSNAYITDVFGFDISPEAIYSKSPENPGAVERIRNLKNYKTKVEFAIGDATRPLENSDGTPGIDSLITKYLIDSRLKQFDLVSCQFALHYYFSSESALRNMLALVSKFLKPGGYFFGTTVDGDSIKKYFGTNNKVIKRSIYKIERMFNTKLKSPFGNKYTFTIFDNKDKTNYFNTIPISEEYLTDFKILNLIAKQYSLEPVNLNFFEPYFVNGKKTYTNTPSNIMSFEDIYRLMRWNPERSRNPAGSRNPENIITPEQLELSFLNSAFVFRKI
jgi:mRNA (guanine-N7-)-methyltransferase